MSRRKPVFSDDEILTIISEERVEVNLAMTQLYQQNYKMVRKLVIKRNGNDQDAKDILQEALIAFYENVKSGNFQLKGKISTYLYRLSDYLIINRLKKNGRLINTSDMNRLVAENTGYSPMTPLLKEEKQDFVRQLMGQLDEKCRQMLTFSIYKNMGMKEIAARLGYQNEQVARNKKHKCLKRLKEIIRKSGHLARFSNELKNE